MNINYLTLQLLMYQLDNFSGRVRKLNVFEKAQPLFKDIEFRSLNFLRFYY